MPVRESLVVGRSSEATWSIADSELSGRHFELRRVDSRLLVRDLDSTNGCAVNGEWLTAPREVETEDLVRAGRCLFVVHPRPATAPSPSRTTAATGTSPADRLAGAPARFVGCLRRALLEAQLDPLPAVAALRTDDLEALTLLGPSARADQEREALALELAALVRDTCDGPAAILHQLVLTRHGDSPVLQRIGACTPEEADEATGYERRRAAILAAYREVGGDVRRLESLLKSRGLPCSRKWLTIFLERWGARAMRLRSR
ncbi:MAG: FHA domain-containing protein [Deltaproteobacteria bacterium]|nr:FHA domain-containing protein [Deltaproteobacteria bacterium]